MKARLSRRINRRAHSAARHGIDAAVEQAPFLQGRCVAYVERSESFFAELSWRPQLARSKCGGRSSSGPDKTLDKVESVRERYRIDEAHALNLITRQRRNPGGVLENTWQKPVSASFEVADGGHLLFLRREAISQRDAGWSQPMLTRV